MAADLPHILHQPDKQSLPYKAFQKANTSGESLKEACIFMQEQMQEERQNIQEMFEELFDGFVRDISENGLFEISKLV